MRLIYQHKDGSPVNPSHCVMPEVTDQTFTVTVRSMTVLKPEAVKALIEARHEVVQIVETCRVVTVK